MTYDCYSTKRTTVWPSEKDGQSGHSIKYADGYISWCPQATFDRDYRAVHGGHLTFGQAIEALKAGKRVRRLGWNGKGMFLIYVPGTPNVEPRAGTPYASLGVAPDGVVTINPHIDKKTATGEMQPGWLASQTDMLSEDWEELK